MRRVLRLGRHRLELHVETSEESSAAPAPVVEPRNDEASRAWTRSWSFRSRRSDDDASQGGPSASWHNKLTIVGAAVIAAALFEGNWPVLLLGIVAVAWGAWAAMRRLSSGVSFRGLAWVAVEVVVVWAALGLILAFGVDGVAMWIAAFAVAFASPFVASRISGVRELR